MPQEAFWPLGFSRNRNIDQAEFQGSGYSGPVKVLRSRVSPVGKAVWFVECHFREDLALPDIAKACDVSPYHLTRAFAIATGHSVMRYLRLRRLTEAAKALARGAPDILETALDAGYNSHEAFTRAFREEFSLTPEALRSQASLRNVKLMEPIKMDETLLTELEQPRLVNGEMLLLGGIGERYNAETCAAIPAQWQKFLPHLGHVPGQVGSTAYGVVCNSDNAGNIDYICGVEVSDFTALPPNWSRLRIPEQRYLVFTHRGHISTIRSVWLTIWNKGLPESGHQASGGPEFERYDENFDPATGLGGFEIWVPVRD